MNAPANQQSFQRQAESTPDFYKGRSECIDAFACLELAIYRLAAVLKVETDSKGQLSQLLKKLKVVPAGPQLSKGNAALLKACCDEVVAILGQRADIVHSQMTVVKAGPSFLAIFRNAVATCANLPDARVYDIAMLGDLAKTTRQIAARFDGFRNKRPQPPNPT